MNLFIRPMTSADTEACARVAFDAHQAVAAAHNSREPLRIGREPEWL